MKKRVIPMLLILTIIFSLSLVLAQDEMIENSYTCLKEKLGTSCGDNQNTEQTAFSLLAMAYDSDIEPDCRNSLKNKKLDDDCWASSGSATCNIKSTALAILALDYVGEDTSDSIDWLLSKRKSAEGLIWFIEVDTNNPATCDISDGVTTASFIINEDKTITGSISGCLTSAEGGYFLRIDEDCIGNNFTISCTENFITTLLYKSDNVYHISSETHPGEAGQLTTEKVEAYCFGLPSCNDYEGNLWATLALAKTGKDVSAYIPFLSSKADFYEKYIPTAFLYMITGIDDYYSKLLEEQKVITTKAQGYWEENNNDLYDTSVALLALQGMGLEEVSKAKKYLMEKREDSGCWKSDTAFILYSGWPKSLTSSGAPVAEDWSDCADMDSYCISPLDCSLENTQDYYCESLSDICCSTQPEQELCEEDKGGLICGSTQTCSGDIVPASDTASCCLGACPETETSTECEDATYVCKFTCSEEEEEKPHDCGTAGNVCCALKPKKESNWLLIILLIILIILVVLAIIFRNQLKIWWFKMKSKFKSGKGPAATKRPPMSPPGFSGQMVQSGRPRQMIPRGRRGAPARRPPARRPGAFGDTMKKLKEMSK